MPHRSMSCLSHPARGVPRPTLAGRIAVAAAACLLMIQILRLLGLAGNGEAWLAASGLFVLTVLVVAQGVRLHYPHDRLGACNVVTMMRAAMVCALLPPLMAQQAGGWAIAATGAVALSLDGVDGWLARRSGLASDLGARFDMEVDAALALVLALHALAGSAVGAEVLFLGLIRYAFVAAGAVLPWLNGALPPRFGRKAICVLQLSVLLVLQVPGLPGDLAIPLARIAALALIWSFAVDIRWLWRHRA